MRPIKIIELKYLAIPRLIINSRPCFMCGRLTDKSKTFVLMYKFNHIVKFIYFDTYDDFVIGFIKRFIFVSSKYDLFLTPSGVDMLFHYYNIRFKYGKYL